MNTTEIGNRTEAFVLGALIRSGRQVLVPFGGGRRYDMVFEEEGKFFRVQCKTGELRTGAVRFPTSSINRDSHVRRHYQEEIEFFGVYCPDNDSVYLVPVDEVGVREGSLRVEQTRNNQEKGVRWAAAYLVN
jgi:hypothetical protein